jgi:ribokinase
MKKRNKAGVVVAGSLNIDYIATVQKLPKPGETIFARNLVQLFGGKGANQAVACARQGVLTAVLGCLGQDGHGDAYIARLKRERVECAGVCRSRTALTGTALIAVDSAGENTIIVAAGANGQLKPSQVRRNANLIRTAAILLTQFEVPVSAILEAMSVAAKAGVAIVLNPSPMREDFPWGRFELDTVIVNEGEAKELGCDPGDSGIFEILGRKRIKMLIITRGAFPTLLVSNDRMMEIPVLKVKPVDTVGAGDAFAGAYAAWRATGKDPVTACRYASVAGSLTTLKHGAQEAMPSRRTTMRFARALGSRVSKTNQEQKL